MLNSARTAAQNYKMANQSEIKILKEKIKQDIKEEIKKIGINPEGKTLKESFCPNCGVKINGVKDFCPNCGKKL